MLLLLKDGIHIRQKFYLESLQTNSPIITFITLVIIRDYYIFFDAPCLYYSIIIFYPTRWIEFYFWFTKNRADYFGCFSLSFVVIRVCCGFITKGFYLYSESFVRIFLWTVSLSNPLFMRLLTLSQIDSNSSNNFSSLIKKVTYFVSLNSLGYLLICEGVTTNGPIF